MRLESALSERNAYVRIPALASATVAELALPGLGVVRGSGGSGWAGDVASCSKDDGQQSQHQDGQTNVPQDGHILRDADRRQKESQEKDEEAISLDALANFGNQRTLLA
jgi:hypothetical protein